MTGGTDGYLRGLLALGRAGWHNLVGLAVVSVAVWVTLLPLAGALAVGTPVVVLGGLWASCLLLGAAVVALFRFAAAVAGRGVRVAVWPELRSAAARPRTGMALGAVTFGVVAAGLAVVGVAPAGRRAAAAGVAGFLLTGWYLLVGLASPELGSGAALRPSLRAGGARFASSPLRAASLLALSAVATLATGLTIVTVVFFLPGVLGLLAAGVATGVAGSGERSGELPSEGERSGELPSDGE